MKKKFLSGCAVIAILLIGSFVMFTACKSDPIPPPTKYNVTVDQAEGGEIEAKPLKAKAGATVELTATPAEDYRFVSFTVTQANGDAVELEPGEGTERTFKMPAAHVTVTGKFIDINTAIFIITLTQPATGGTISADKDSAEEDDIVTITAVPATDFRLNSITVDPAAAVTINGNVGTFAMPASDVTVTATFIDENTPTFAITLTQPATGGTIASDKENAIEGDTITITATPDTGYILSDISVTPEQEVSITDNVGTFTMPGVAVTVTATFALPEYDVIIDEAITNGTVTATPDKAKDGDTVTITIKRDTGSILLSGPTVTGESGPVALTRTVTDTWTFTMPAEEVTVTAEFGSPIAAPSDKVITLFTAVGDDYTGYTATGANWWAGGNVNQQGWRSYQAGGDGTVSIERTNQTIDFVNDITDFIDTDPIVSFWVYLRGPVANSNVREVTFELRTGNHSAENSQHIAWTAPSFNVALNLPWNLGDRDSHWINMKIPLEDFVNSSGDSITVLDQIVISGWKITTDNTNYWIGNVIELVKNTPSYTITVAPVAGATVAIGGGLTKAWEGDTIRMIANVDEGSILSEIQVAPSATVTTSNHGENATWQLPIQTFTMPSANATITPVIKTISPSVIENFEGGTNGTALTSDGFALTPGTGNTLNAVYDNASPQEGTLSGRIDWAFGGSADSNFLVLFPEQTPRLDPITTEHTYVSLWAKSSAAGTYYFGTYDGATGTTLRRADTSNLLFAVNEVGIWKHFSIPISAFGNATQQGDIRRFVIQGRTNDGHLRGSGSLSIDNIRFVAGAPVMYAINLHNHFPGGSIKTNVVSARSGETITITAPTGVTISSVKVTKSGDAAVDTAGTGNSRTFTMPSEAVTVTANVTFAATAPIIIENWAPTFVFPVATGTGGWIDDIMSNVAAVANGYWRTTENIGHNDRNLIMAGGRGDYNSIRTTESNWRMLQVTPDAAPASVGRNFPDPVNLSGRTNLSIKFRVAQDGDTYSVMLYNGGTGGAPSSEKGTAFKVPITQAAAGTWATIDVPLTSFTGLNLNAVTGWAIEQTTKTTAVGTNNGRFYIDSIWVDAQ